MFSVKYRRFGTRKDTLNIYIKQLHEEIKYCMVMFLFFVQTKRSKYIIRKL
jgi:hypothetical protein